MKNIWVLILAFIIPAEAFAGSYIDKQLKEAKKNVKNNSVQVQLKDTSYADLDIQKQDIKNIKDPKLIKLSDIKPIEENLYQKKLEADNETYEKQVFPALKAKTNTVNIEPRAVDFYKVYRIAERLIRANQLDHQNWRIAIRKTDDVNAYASDTNLVVIYTGLYDSLYTNEDALAYVIAHEMAHNILGHTRRLTEMSMKLEKMERNVKIDRATHGGRYGLISTSAALAYKQKMARESRMMEYTADAEGFNMLIKAGYSPSKALYALKFIETMDPRVWIIFRDHPETPKRIENANEIISYANPDWVDEGKYNIYNSDVLPVKKSSDHVSIVISANQNAGDYYSPETYEQRLTRLAYVSYQKGDMQNAIKYFEKLLDVQNDYITNLYLSYANEYLYMQVKDEKYKKAALKYAQNAKSLNSNDNNVNEQLKSVENL